MFSCTPSTPQSLASLAFRACMIQFQPTAVDAGSFPAFFQAFSDQHNLDVEILAKLTEKSSRENTKVFKSYWAEQSILGGQMVEEIQLQIAMSSAILTIDDQDILDHQLVLIDTKNTILADKPGSFSITQWEQAIDLMIKLAPIEESQVSKPSALNLLLRKTGFSRAGFDRSGSNQIRQDNIEALLSLKNQSGMADFVSRLKKTTNEYMSVMEKSVTLEKKWRARITQQSYDAQQKQILTSMMEEKKKRHQAIVDVVNKTQNLPVLDAEQTKGLMGWAEWIIRQADTAYWTGILSKMKEADIPVPAILSHPRAEWMAQIKAENP